MGCFGTDLDGYYPFIGLMIAAQAMLKNSDIAYGLVVIWAYAGILIKHLSSGGFDGKYPLIIVTAVFSMILLAAEAVYLVISRKTAEPPIDLQNKLLERAE